MTFLAAATEKGTVVTSAKIALFVGSILVAINTVIVSSYMEICTPWTGLSSQ